jgi:hypothetical protein
MGWGYLKYLQNNWTNFNPDLAQIILGKNDSKFVQLKGIAPLQGNVIANE